MSKPCLLTFGNKFESILAPINLLLFLGGSQFNPKTGVRCQKSWWFWTFWRIQTHCKYDKSHRYFPQRNAYKHTVVALEVDDSDLLPDNCCLQRSWWTLPAATPSYPWQCSQQSHTFPGTPPPPPLSAGLRCSRTILKFETFYPKLPFLSPFTDVKPALWSHF